MHACCPKAFKLERDNFCIIRLLTMEVPLGLLSKWFLQKILSSEWQEEVCSFNKDSVLSKSAILLIYLFKVRGTKAEVFCSWALSSISLPIERAPPLSNSLHTIYFVPLSISILYQFSVSIVLISL